MPERCRWVNNCFVARYHSLFSIASSPLLVCTTTKTYHEDISVTGICPLLGFVRYWAPWMARSKAAAACSSCSSVCAAETCVRILALPCGTTG